MELTKEQQERENWVKMTIAISGEIYDSEYMNYVYDDIISPKIAEHMELDYLVINQITREKAVEKYKEFIDKMVEKVNGKSPKGIMYRTWLRARLYYGATKLFDNIEEEYHFINVVLKFGRGMWYEQCMRHFSKKDQETIVELAHAYGAFDHAYGAFDY